MGLKFLVRDLEYVRRRTRNSPYRIWKQVPDLGEVLLLLQIV